MQNTVYFSIHLTPHAGKREEFESVAKGLTEVSRAEPGTLGYSWFVEGDSYRLIETYADAAAVEAHFRGPAIQEWLPKLVAACDVNSFEIYGDPGRDVAETTSRLGARLFSYWMGLDR